MSRKQKWSLAALAFLAAAAVGIGVWRDVAQPHVCTFVRTLRADTHPVKALAFVADGQELVTCAGGFAKLWDTATGEMVAVLDEESSTVAAAPPTRTTIAIGTSQGVVKLIDMADRHVSARFVAHDRPVEALAFSPDGRALASASQGVKIWHMPDGGLSASLGRRARGVSCVAFSPDAKLLASGSHDGTVVLWDLERLQPRTPIRAHSGYVHCVAFHPSEPILASGGGDRSLRLWDVATGKLRLALDTHDTSVRCMAFRASDGLLVTGGGDPSIFSDGSSLVDLWDPIREKRRQSLMNHRRWVTAIDLSPRGDLLATASYDGTVNLWRVGTDD